MITPKLRLFVDQEHLTINHVFHADNSQAHYLLNVMRLKENDFIAIFNGHDGEWLAKIVDTKKKTTNIQCLKQLKSQPNESDIWLMFAPLKKDRLDYLSQKASELGVSDLMPVKTARTIVSRVKLERIALNSIEACEQCERLSIPKIHEYQSLTTALSDWDKERLLIFLDENGSGNSILQVLQSEEIQNKHYTKFAIVVGPEGGFTKEEATHIKKIKPATAVSLGSRILRADTAIISSLSCLQASLGDWPNTKPTRP